MKKLDLAFKIFSCNLISVLKQSNVYKSIAIFCLKLSIYCSTIYISANISIKLYCVLNPAKISYVLIPINFSVYFILTLILLPFKHIRQFNMLSEYSKTLPIKHSTMILAKYMDIYLNCLALFVCISLPANILYLLSINCGVCSYILLILVSIIMPTIPCSIISIISVFLERFSNKRFTINLIYTVIKCLLSIFIVYVLLFIDIESTALLIAQTTSFIQIVFFPSAFMLRVLNGAIGEAIILALISITFSYMSQLISINLLKKGEF